MHKRRRDHDLDLLRDDQVLTAGKLLARRVLGQRCAHGRPLLQVFVRIDVDDLIERTELSVPEGPQF
jgi:hypothetical protein